MYSMPPSEACSTALKEKKQSKKAKERFFFLNSVTEMKSSYPSKVSDNDRQKTPAIQ